MSVVYNTNTLGNNCMPWLSLQNNFASENFSVIKIQGQWNHNPKTRLGDLFTNDDKKEPEYFYNLPMIYNHCSV